MARKSLQNALQYKQLKEKNYLKFITHFGPAFTGIGFWNKKRFANKQVNCSWSLMRLSFTCAFTTTVKPGKLRKKGKKEKKATYKFQ